MSLTVKDWLLPRYATCSPDDAANYADLWKKGCYRRLPTEEQWSHRQSYLQERGYMLRPRYYKGWTPSWLGTLRRPESCEDSIQVIYAVVLDATRIRDGIRVAVKVVKQESPEIGILQALTSVELLLASENHCVPILDILPDPLDICRTLLVTPHLQPCNDPPFEVIDEVLDFIKQTLDGLRFLHDQGVAYRNFGALDKIMMDARALYPEGNHPVRFRYKEDGVSFAPRRSRHHSQVRYYFVDFRHSLKFNEGELPCILGASYIPYNVFFRDILDVGRLYYEEFVMKYQDLDFLLPLLDSMMQQDPSCRTTAEGACSMLEETLSALEGSYLQWRLRPRTGESITKRIAYDTYDLAKAGVGQLKEYFV